MFRFTRERILPLFLQRRMTTAELARVAGVSHKAATRAVNGLPVQADIVGKVADALNVDAVQFLDPPRPLKGCD